MSVAIRPATIADIPAITRIYAHAVEHGTASFELTPPDEAEMTRRMQAILDGNFPISSPRSTARVAGYAYAVALPHAAGLSLHRRGFGLCRARTCIAAASAARCSTKLIEACTARGFRQMIAVIGDSDQAASIGVHEACGFADAGNLQHDRLQIRPLARYAADAARAGSGRDGAAAGA